MKPLFLALTALRSPAIQSIVKQSLNEAGHRVVESPVFESAYALLTNGLSPDLLIVESSGKGEDWQKLTDLIAPDRICVIAGPEEATARKAAADLGIRHVLATPVSREAVHGVVEQMASASGLSGLNPPQSNDAKVAEVHAKPPAPSRLVLEELGGEQFFLAASPAMLNIYRQVKLLADSDVPVLILGESGTGKEVIAHLIHQYSQRARHKFLKVNCAALPSDLLESELFGHQKGAFTGAIKDRAGKFEQADGGTLLLDEIGEMSAQMQAKILHVLQDGQFTRLGAQESSKVDVRVLGATNVHMESALREKAFREDLYYRLSVFTISIPPLRERREEIPYLIEETIRRAPAEMKYECDCSFSTRLMDAAMLYDWRGNLRELRNFVTRTMIMRDPDAGVRELEAKIGVSVDMVQRTNGDAISLPCSGMRSIMRDVKDRTEAQLILDALEASNWNRRHAAQYLDISYRGLLYKIQQHRLKPRHSHDSRDIPGASHSLRGNTP
ncbi:MAG TPA: sigma-54 dependent transcriptional regulator [Terracidiphilus sp.]|nr:sigma-54 dependent transcriptional regulator [Terracidiphilus sp.]